MSPVLPRLPASHARRLFLAAQGLLDDPARPADLQALVEKLGFVQLDSINVVERAHHLTLAARLDAYRPPMLHDLIEKRRTLFENWTHDASAIPTALYPHWHHRFRRYQVRIRSNAWWRERLGKSPRRLLSGVLERVRSEGPLLSRDFEHDGKGESGGWWGWKPQKAALEHLWRAGALAVTRRVNFQKVYDLAERAYPDLHARPPSPRKDHLDWACRSALERLGVATPAEIAAFWRAVPVAEAAAWCRREAECVEVESPDGSVPRKAFALAGWEGRLKSCPEAPDRMRLLSPFDPVVRDRRRLARLFKFDYTIEVFVPAPKRKYGYYVMPVLDGERLVARVDPKFDRDQGRLEIRRVWWEPGVRPSRARLEAAAARLAASIGAESIALPVCR